MKININNNTPISFREYFKIFGFLKYEIKKEHKTMKILRLSNFILLFFSVLSAAIMQSEISKNKLKTFRWIPAILLMAIGGCIKDKLDGDVIFKENQITYRKHYINHVERHIPIIQQIEGKKFL